MSISPTSCLCIIALVAGCNAFYGLDETSLNADRDQDGVLDSDDNCPAIANPDQQDTSTLDRGGDACAQCPAQIGIDLDGDNYDDGCDRCLGPGHPPGAPLQDADGDALDDRCDPCVGGASSFEIDFNQNGIGDGCEVCLVEPALGDSDQDGLDDACDKCLAGPPHDEDGDGIEDACDNCPFDPNPDQLPGGGAIGEVCRAQIASNVERALFEPFLVRDNFRWLGVTGTWTIGGDRAALAAGVGTRTISTRWIGEFRAVMRARFPTADDSAFVSIEVRESGGGFEQCRISRTGRVEFGSDSAQTPRTEEPITIELYHSNANLVQPFRCVVTVGSQSVELTSEPIAGKLRMTVGGAGPFELGAVDLVVAAPTPVPL